MIYSDAENELWWKRLTQTDRLDILATMFEKSSSESFTKFVNDLTGRLERKMPLSLAQIAAIRKWAK